MGSLVARLDRRLGRAPVDTGLAVENEAVGATSACDGPTIDRAAFAQELAALLFSLHGTELTVPMKSVGPAVYPEDDQAAS